MADKDKEKPVKHPEDTSTGSSNKDTIIERLNKDKSKPS